MVSIITNNAAKSALSALRSSGFDANATQTSISTGFRISTARDNASYWSIATTMRSDNVSLSAVRDSLGLSLSVVDTAYTTQDIVLSGIDRMSTIFTAGLLATNEQRKTYDTEIKSITAGVLAAIKSASFNGINLLYHATGETYERKLVSSISRDGSGQVAIGSIAVDLQQVALVDDVATGGVLSKNYTDSRGYTSGRMFFGEIARHAYPLSLFPNFAGNTPFNQGGVKASIEILDNMASAVRTVYAGLGAMKARLEGQLDVTNLLSDIQKKGIGRLVDADMNAESAKLRANQAREQLASQSLQIANNAPSGVLQLFTR